MKKITNKFVNHKLIRGGAVNLYKIIDRGNNKTMKVTNRSISIFS